MGNSAAWRAGSPRSSTGRRDWQRRGALSRGREPKSKVVSPWDAPFSARNACLPVGRAEPRLAGESGAFRHGAARPSQLSTLSSQLSLFPLSPLNSLSFRARRSTAPSLTSLDPSLLSRSPSPASSPTPPIALCLPGTPQSPSSSRNPQAPSYGSESPADAHAAAPPAPYS